MERRAQKVKKTVEILKETFKHEPELWTLPFSNEEKKLLADYYDWTLVLSAGLWPKANIVSVAALHHSIEALKSFLFSRRSRLAKMSCTVKVIPATRAALLP